MSHTLTAYFVAPSALRSFWGSRNAGPVADELADDLAELSAWMEDLDVPPDVSARAILQDIADGSIRHEDTAAFAYGYVYEHLCALFGDRAGPDEDGGGPGYTLRDVGEIERDASAFIPIPISDDSPHVASYGPGDLQTARARLTAAARTHAEADDRSARQLGALFDRAEAEGTGVVLFTS